MNNNFILPVTIVISGLLIAGAVFFVGKSSVPTPNSGNTGQINYRPVDGSDYILGNPNAPIKVIEYADLECLYCKQFHTTMHQIMEHYGNSGNVAWVFRNFPLAQIHSKALKEAEAAECAADQGGSTAFFKYIDRLYEVTPSNNNLDASQLPIIAKDAGLNVDLFNTCLSSGKKAEKVQASYNDAIAAGGNGTPYILITLNNSKEALVLSGAQPYDSMRAAIDSMMGTITAPAGATTTTP